MNTLNAGTTHCPRDKSILHFEQMGGMRLYRKNDQGVEVFEARCPLCGKTFYVRRGAA